MTPVHHIMSFYVVVIDDQIMWLHFHQNYIFSSMMRHAMHINIVSYVILYEDELVAASK